MNTGKRTYYVTLFMSFLWAFAGISVGYGQGKFVQNMGQWNNAVVSRAGLRSGAIFLCKNQIRYGFLNPADVAAFHANPYSTDTLKVHGQAFFLDWINSNPNVATAFQNQYPEYYNYYLGNDPSKWKSGVHAYSDFTYTNLYPGIDLSLNAENTDLEYTYTVESGSNPASIQVKIAGADSIFIQDSDLHIYSPTVQIVEKSPYAYQYIGDQKVTVPCLFRITNGNIESFIFPKGYDDSKPLIIDPLVIFATYSGSTADNWGFTATYDSLGEGYSGGTVFGAGFPVTPGAYQASFAGGTNWSPSAIKDLQVMGLFARDIGILKYTPDGKNLIYATYLGGKTGNEQPHSMIVDKSNNLVVMGTTASSDFPVSSTAYSKKFDGETDIFVSKFSADGKKLLASTYIGGSGYDGLNGIDSVHLDTSGNYIYASIYAGTKLFYNYGDQFRGDVETDASNNIYIASSTLSSDFPTTSGSFQPHFGGGKQDGIVLKIDSNLQHLVWSTYLGGTKDDGAYSLQVAADRSVFVCGGTLSPYFFPSGPSYQNTNKGNVDGYICHLKSDGSGVIRATYFGTDKYDQIYLIQLDQSQNVYVYGQTESTSFPVYNVTYSNPNSGNFVTKFNNGLDSIIYSTVFGSGKGVPDVSPTAFLVDKCEKVYISGWGGELDYPALSRLHKVYSMPITADAYQPKTVDSSDFYVAVFDRNFDDLLYASYFGGPKSEEHVDGGTSRFDKNGIIYQSVCGGCGAHSDFPTTPGAWSRTNNSDNCNNLLFKVDLQIPSLKAGFIGPSFACFNIPVTFKNTSTLAVSYLWNFGDNSPESTDTTPTHSYVLPGSYKVTLVATNLNSCEVRDTVTRKVIIYKQAKASFNVQEDSCSRVIRFMQTGESNTSSWDFGDDDYSDSLNGLHTYNVPGHYNVTLLVDSGTSCADSFSAPISIVGVNADFTYNFVTCSPWAFHFTNLSTGAIKSYKWYLPFVSTDTAKNPFFNFNTSVGTYPVSLVAIDSLGCRDSVTKNVTAYNKVTAGFSDSVYACTGKVFVKNNSTGVNSFRWYFSDGTTSTADSLVHQFPSDSMFTVSIVTDSGSGCTDTLKKTIIINHPEASYKYGIDTCSGQVLFTNTSAEAVSSVWSFDSIDSSTSQNAAFKFRLKGQYPVKLKVLSSAGCIDSTTQLVNIANSERVLKIPNVFTPNGDQYNNVFKITGLNPCNVYDFSVYNRWGQLFYHSTGNNFTWNGNYNGIKVPEGVYYYDLTGKSIGQMTGTITVVY